MQLEMVFSCVADCYLTSVSNALRNSTDNRVLGPQRFNDLPEMRFEFLFTLIGKSTMDFLTGQSRRVLKSWYTAGPRTKISALFRRRA